MRAVHSHGVVLSLAILLVSALVPLAAFAACEDELVGLIKSFNQMTQDLDANSRELETRRRFTEAILESIPTGVISVNATGVIQRVNRALKDILPFPVIDRAMRLDDLFSKEDTAEIRYLMNLSLIHI